MPVRIFIIEDHPVMREMLTEFLMETPELDVCGASGTADEALEYLSETEVDLVLVDVALPEKNGIDAVKELQARHPGLKCLMISGHGESNYVRRSLDAGASGYLLKGDPAEILEAIREVNSGGMYLSEAFRSFPSTSQLARDTRAAS